MTVKVILVLCFSSVLVFSLPATDDDAAAQNKLLTCDEVFSKAGLNYSSFWKGAAHGIHSLSLEEIRYFFKAEAPEDNRIPTVNIDFRSEEVIHFSAPLWGYEERFESWALKIMDWFMINNQPYLYETVSNNFLHFINDKFVFRAPMLWRNSLTSTTCMKSTRGQ